MKIFYLGAEQATHRSSLHDAGIDNVGMSWWSWSKRMPKKGVNIASYAFDGVLLDGGGHHANKHPDALDVAGWKAYAESYRCFVEDHIDDLTLVVEFDCLKLGVEWIAQQRRDFWSQIDPEKFLPVWHPETGLPELERLSQNYPRIAVTEDSVSTKPGAGPNATPRLNALAAGGTKLHGLAMTKPETLVAVNFTTVASTSWLSPAQYGDTIIWDGARLHRYPVKMKDQVRGGRHEALLRREGFDVDRIRADDHHEVTALSLWSWKSFEDHLNMQANRSNTLTFSDQPANTPTAPDTVATIDGAVVDTSTGEVTTLATAQDGSTIELHPPKQAGPPPAPETIERPAEELVMLPMLRIETETAKNDDQEDVDLSLVHIRGKSERRCNDCVISSRCPQMKPNYTCAYEIPVSMRNPKERRAMMDGLLEMQVGRVLFAAHVEQANGGYPDPNLSSEYDRLWKSLATASELADGRDFVKISIEAKGGAGAPAGLFTELFGEAPAARLAQGRQEPTRVIDADETDALLEQLTGGLPVRTE